MKKCTVCKQEKDILEFHKSALSKDGHFYQCRSCRNSGRDKYYQAHRERRKVVSRYNHLRRTYDITDHEYAMMLEAQQHKCKICGKHELELKRKLDIDHDHRTGKVRGLLCTTCNINPGRFKDDPQLFISAAQYLLLYVRKKD